MIRRNGFLILISLFLLFSSIGSKPIQKINQDPMPFPETGYYVSGEFLDFYLSVDDPKRIFGLPITEVFPDPFRENIQIQYFERVRMELDPSMPAGQRISLAKLGKWLYDETQRGMAVDLPVNNSLCRYFPKNDKYVCYGFLQMYDRYDGAKYFGEPISNVEYVNNRLVQYFENVRMEWRNELPLNQKVVLTEIGRIDMERRVGDLGSHQRLIYPDYPTPPVVMVFVNRPLLAPNEDQIVYVLVRDEYSRPIKGAQVEITISIGGKDPMNISVRHATDKDGLAQETIKIPNTSPNQVIDIRARAKTPEQTEGEGVTWFRIWW